MRFRAESQSLMALVLTEIGRSLFSAATFFIFNFQLRFLLGPVLMSVAIVPATCDADGDRRGVIAGIRVA